MIRVSHGSDIIRPRGVGWISGTQSSKTCQPASTGLPPQQRPSAFVRAASSQTSARNTRDCSVCRYAASLYWSITTIVTVGYGTPQLAASVRRSDPIREQGWIAQLLLLQATSALGTRMRESLLPRACSWAAHSMRMSSAVSVRVLLHAFVRVAGAEVPDSCSAFSAYSLRA
jgi:hypothetical protein